MKISYRPMPNCEGGTEEPYAKAIHFRSFISAALTVCARNKFLYIYWHIQKDNVKFAQCAAL